jgi:hypothetical protein
VPEQSGPWPGTNPVSDTVFPATMVFWSCTIPPSFLILILLIPPPEPPLTVVFSRIVVLVMETNPPPLNTPPPPPCPAVFFAIVLLIIVRDPPRLSIPPPNWQQSEGLKTMALFFTTTEPLILNTPPAPIALLCAIVLFFVRRCPEFHYYRRSLSPRHRDHQNCWR